MPWMLEGNCVHKKNDDGSKGKLIKCHDSSEEAKAHMRALYANVKDSIVETSMYITKSTISNGIMRWTAVNSDVDWDLHGEKMSLDMYKSMLGKISRKDPPPEEFKSMVCSEYWCGGMPYLSVSHYADFNGQAVPGEPVELFIDGKQLKAKGILFDNEWGEAVWKSLKEDENKPLDSDRIRISIAFLDLAHKHGDTGEVYYRKSMYHLCPECLKGTGDKIYTDGYLVHLALTRVPVNPRTIMEVEKSMATKKTRKEDAASIVGEQMADTLEELAKVENKSDVLVEMSDVEEIVEEKSDAVVEEAKTTPKKDEPVDDEAEDEKDCADGKKDKKMKGKSMATLAGNQLDVKIDWNESNLREVIKSLVQEEVHPVKEKSAIDTSVENLYTTIGIALKSDADMEAKLQSINPALQDLGVAITNIVKSSVTQSKSETVVGDTDKLILDTLKNLSDTVSAFGTELALLKQTQKSEPEQQPRIPAPRSISPDLLKSVIAKSQPEEIKPGSVADIARRSV